MSKDNEFYRWNITNIMANMLQCEDHLCTVIDKIAPEHAACCNKHLTNAIGELLEISKHCYIAAPEKCKGFKQLAQDVFKVKNDLEDNGIDDKSTLTVRALRKQFEHIIGTSTDECELGFCKFNPEEQAKKAPEDNIIVEIKDE